jgi:MFS family permease
MSALVAPLDGDVTAVAERMPPQAVWTLAITSVAVFMVTLDNLVVTTAIPVIRQDLHASLSGLQWTVNAYTLTFAVLLLTGAALGDRFGRRRLLAIGVAVFTAASAGAALAPSIGALDVARALQRVGGAIVMPLTLTVVSAAVPAARRGVALGIWGGISGLAVALGPLVGGAIVTGISWHWIFWLNVPIGLALLPFILLRLEETRGPATRLDLPGLVLGSTGLVGLVWALVRANDDGWTSPQIISAFILGSALLASFVAWEPARRAPDASDALLSQPDVRAGQRCEPVHVLWNVRLDLFHRPVLSNRARPVAASVGAADPAVDGDADARRADRGRGF